ncbi:LOG family protein [Iodobacter ciconiae]|uniref:Cytokinin riboside 5'-monophosphate phosphoribohydrolase n=1 Tax=Iodobacter ciconiae TaxID=2496266 RepID=A0A3S8ZR99_9NEIS|nr:TIGR00730 family Rossman fold protein [Iodobacter ciconiae]AZN35997.1 TIGR00730 family Rossman fold protein [Iodobacter ciconiae]
MKSVAVFCGAKHGIQPEFTTAARELGAVLAEREITLVYGGGHVGLMGEVATACLDAGGKVIGVIPEFMVVRELALEACSELIIVDSMHTRKAKMAELAGGFIAMPGGFGTLDELFEILTWSQVGLHGKPVGLLNTGNYYDSLTKFLEETVAAGFLAAAEYSKLQSASDPRDLLNILASQPGVMEGMWWKT